MEERQSAERCAGCPFRYAPPVTSEVADILQLYLDLDSPVGMRMPELVIEAHKPKMTNLEFLQIVKCMNEIAVMILERKKPVSNGN